MPDDGPLWKFKTMDSDAVQTLCAALDLPPLICGLLAQRGITTADGAETYLNPLLDSLDDPLALPDMEKAVLRLSRAIDTHETIFLHGDYDVDGVTSSALCYRALTTLGATVIPHIPKRSDGYDLQIAGVERAREKEATLLLTVDCGSKAVAAVEYANSLGMEVIITDHHRPDHAALPPALALVNPYREDANVAFQALAGAGVAFKLMDALIAHRQPTLRQAFRRQYLDLVALGTVADVTPLVGENRILVSHGLRALATTKKKGLRALLSSLHLLNGVITSDDIGWKIGPPLNAVGRQEDARLAFDLLVASDDDHAEQLVAQIMAIREIVKAESARVTTEAVEEALSPKYEGHRVLVLARDKWGKGILGLVANRVVEALHRPVFLLSHDTEHNVYVGSGRTRGDFPLHEVLEKCSEFFVRYGGHSASAGLALKAEYLEDFRRRINEIAEDYLPAEPEPMTLEIDAEISDGRALTFTLLEQLDLLQPCGQQNPEPVFATRNAIVLSARRCGADGNTFQMTVRLPGMESGGMACVWFRNGEWADRLHIGDEVDIAYRPKVNVYRDKMSVQLMLEDIKLSA